MSDLSNIVGDLDRLMEAAQREAEKARDTQADPQAEAVGSALDGRVKATLGPDGRLRSLELADELQLTLDQRARTQALFDRMQREAAALGEEMIVAERELDRLFRDNRVTPENLAAATSKAALAQGRVRESHLRYHLAMMEVLSPEQVSQYNRLRGY